MVEDWKAKADAKRDAILNSIPEKWRLSKIPTAQEQKDVTGSYIQQFLDKNEIEITETDAVGIAKQTAAGTWTAVEVAEAFCHRAALAHQLVGGQTRTLAITDGRRSIVCMRLSSTLPLQMPKRWMSTLRSTRSPSALSMACQCLSRTNSM